MIDPHALVDLLPPPPALERRCIALAMMDALLSPEWEYRYFSFNRRWDVAAATRMASMRDGIGDEYFVLFLADGTAAIKGLAHESAALDGRLSIPGLFDGIPPSFGPFLEEKAFRMEEATVGLWFTPGAGDGRWHRSASLDRATIAADGSGELLALLVGEPAEYVAFARDYFEAEVSVDAVARFFRHEPLTDDLAVALHGMADVEAIAEELDEIGYPRSTAAAGR